MVASAFLSKGNPALYWIKAALMVAALTFVILRSRQPGIRPWKTHSLDRLLLSRYNLSVE